MTTSKKLQEETIKDVKTTINDLLKTLDIAFEPSKAIINDIMEYLKRRTEVENEYATRLARLADKLEERIEKLYPLVQTVDGKLDTRYEMYNLLKCFENEVKLKSDIATKFSENINNSLLPVTNKYIDFQNFKTVKCKEMLSEMGDKLILEVNNVFAKRIDYIKALSIEKKSTKAYATAKSKQAKAKKPSSSFISKSEKIHSAYINDMINTDRYRNMYILAYHSSRCCNERFFLQQTADVVLLGNFKFGELMHHFKSLIIGIFQQYQEGIVKNSAIFDKLHFSDAVESDAILDKYKNKLLDGSIKMTFQLSSFDSESTIMISGPLKKELIEYSKQLESVIMKTVEELSEKVQHLSDLRETTLDWDKTTISIDSYKERKPVTIKKFGTSNESWWIERYFCIAESYMVLDTELYHKKTTYTRLLQALESPFLEQRTRIPLDTTRIKKLMEYGVDLTEHCTSNGLKIPALISICVQFLYSNDLFKSTGIFRISSSTASINSAKDSIMDTGKIPKDSDPFVIANIIKQYLRELKNFIDPKVFPSEIAQLAYLPDEKFIEETKKSLATLSDHSRNLIIFMAKLLVHISQFSKENKMDLNNLSIVFGPTLFCADFNASSLNIQNDINRFLNLFCEKIFQIYPEELPLFSCEEDRSERRLLPSTDASDLQEGLSEGEENATGEYIISNEVELKSLTEPEAE